MITVPKEQGLSELRHLARRRTPESLRQRSRPEHGGFHWCMTAIDWGWPIEETASKLPDVSEKSPRVRTDRE